MSKHQKTITNCLKITVFILLATIFLRGVPVFAAECGGVETGIVECESTGGGAIREIAIKVVNIMSIGVGVIGVIGITIAGIQYLTAGGNEEQTRKAKRRITEIIIGLGVYVVIWSILNWLLPGGVFLEQIEAENISFSNQNISMSVGDTASLRASLYPLDASDKITYSSSNPKVATVDSTGRVVAKSSGSTVITAKTPKGKTANTTITITQNLPPGGSSPASSDGSSGGSSGGQINSTTGLTEAQAQKLADYFNNDAPSSEVPGGAKNDCSAFVSWFISQFTNISSAPNATWVYGKDVVNTINSKFGIPVSTSYPKPFTVFSTTTFHGNNHTGLIVGFTDGKTITVESAYPNWWDGKMGARVFVEQLPSSGLTYSYIGDRLNKNKLSRVTK